MEVERERARETKTKKRTIRIHTHALALTPCSFEYDLCMFGFIWIVNLLPWDNLEYNEVITFIAYNNASPNVVCWNFCFSSVIFVILFFLLCLIPSCNDAGQKQIHEFARRLDKRKICNFISVELLTWHNKTERIYKNNEHFNGMNFMENSATVTNLGAKLNWWGRSKPLHASNTTICFHFNDVCKQTEKKMIGGFYKSRTLHCLTPMDLMASDAL